MFIHRIKKMPFDEDFAEYQRCLIASSVADTYDEAIQEWEVIDLEYHPDKDLISFSNRVRSHTAARFVILIPRLHSDRSANLD